MPLSIHHKGRFAKLSKVGINLVGGDVTLLFSILSQSLLLKNKQYECWCWWRIRGDIYCPLFVLRMSNWIFSLRFWDTVWLRTLLRWAHKENSKGLAQWLMFGLWRQSIWFWVLIPNPQGSMVLDTWLHLSTSESQIMVVSTSCGFCEQKITCVCVVFDDFELSNYYLSLSSLWLLHNLPEGALLLVSAQDLSPPPARCGAHIFLCVLCIADSTLLISACRRGHRITSLEIWPFTSPHIHPFTPPQLCFLSSRRYQIGNGWPDLCKWWGSKQQEKKQEMNWPELSPCNILGTELGISSPPFHLIILEKQILSFPFYTWANRLWQTVKQNDWSHVDYYSFHSKSVSLPTPHAFSEATRLPFQSPYPGPLHPHIFPGTDELRKLTDTICFVGGNFASGISPEWAWEGLAQLRRLGLRCPVLVPEGGWASLPPLGCGHVSGTLNASQCLTSRTAGSVLTSPSSLSLQMMPQLCPPRSN